jgi:hypothetical protein
MKRWLEGLEAAKAGVLPEASTVVLLWDAVSAPMICAQAVTANWNLAAGD